MGRAWPRAMTQAVVGAVDVKRAADEQSLYVLYNDRDANQFLQWDTNTTQVVHSTGSGSYTGSTTRHHCP